MNRIKPRSLPPDVIRLLQQYDAPPRLVAHLELVHDVACLLIVKLRERLPELTFDEQAVMIGAATHDIGKAVCKNELTGPGNNHEIEGRAMLLKAGFCEAQARFAITHGGPKREPNPTIEDLLVRTADAIWKGGRYKSSEMQLVRAIALATGAPEWQVFTSVDDVLTELAEDADARLGYQNAAPL